MPRNATQSPFTGQSLKGMELDVRLEDQTTENWACLFAATAFDVQVAAATTSRQHTLNKGSRTSTGAAGEITATADVFVVPDSPGQWAINEAFKSGKKVRIRRCVFAEQVGDDVVLSATATFGIAKSPATQSEIDGVGAGVPKSGGLVALVDTTGTPTNLIPLMREVEPGMTIQVGTENFFVGYRAPDASNMMPQLYISPSPDDNHATPGSRASLIDTYPYIGAVVPPKTSGTLKVYRGRVEQTLYTGTVTVPVVATDAAPGDDGNDLSTAQISFALDDIGTPSYRFA